MQREFTENLNKILQCFSETASDVAELNVELLNRISRTASLSQSEMGQVKKPDDLLRTVNTNVDLIRDYYDELSKIYMINGQRFMALTTQMTRQAGAQAERATEKATKFAKKVKKAVKA